MSKWTFSPPLLRSISNSARELIVLTNTRQLPPDAKIPAQLHLPDVRISAQYFIDMGFQPEVAHRLSSVFMDFVFRYKQVTESSFDRIKHGGGHLSSTYYRDVYVILFERTIQEWGSRLLSTAWVWLRQTGLSSATFRVKEISIRRGPTKFDVISRAGLKTPFVAMERTHPYRCTKTPSQPEGRQITSISHITPHAKKFTPQCHDPFSSAAPPTCFPARYPPALSESCSSTQVSLATSFTPKASVQNEKLPVNRTTDLSSLSHVLGRLAITAPEVGVKVQPCHKGFWAFKAKKSEPLSPLLSPIVAGASSFSNECHPVKTASAPSAEAAAVPRRRRIAGLPKRRTKATPDTPVPDVVTFSSCNSTPYASTSPSIRVFEVEEVNPSSHSASPKATHSQLLPSPFTTEASRPKAESVIPRQRKVLPLPRRGSSQPKTALPTSQGPTLLIPSTRRVSPPSQTRPPTPLAPSGQKISSSNVSRTPSLVSDTSSCADTLSSSDEFDTPPSTPPSYSDGLTACNTLAMNTNSKSKPTGPFGLPILANAEPRREKGIRIDFTDGDAIGERQVGFTFHA